MSLEVKFLAISSLVILLFAAYIGFVDKDDRNDSMYKFKDWINNTLKWKWLQKRYILTRITLAIGLILGIWSIVIS